MKRVFGLVYGTAPRSGLSLTNWIEADLEAVTELLGRPPLGNFQVVLRNDQDVPMVIRNAPFLQDGTPMPTLYWLVDKNLCERIGRLESNGGVVAAGKAIDPHAIADAHARYAQERSALIPLGYQGPRPTGGVGGTRQGVKCLHAHYAWFLMGGDDPVGSWVHEQLKNF